MKTTNQLFRTLNSTITRRVIEFHLKGYTDDFSNTTGQKFVCLQSGEHFSRTELIIKLIDIDFDQLDYSCKYIHTVEAPNGDKGLLIAKKICSLNPASVN
jgi:hypothetical protein